MRMLLMCFFGLFGVAVAIILWAIIAGTQRIDQRDFAPHRPVWAPSPRRRA